MNEWMSEWVIEWASEQATDRTNKRTKERVLAKLVGRPDAGESELYSLLFEKVGKDQARLQAIKEWVQSSFELLLL